MECPLCRRDLKPSLATFTALRYGHPLLLDDISAWICGQCGEPVFEEKVIEAIQLLLMRTDK